MQTDTKRGEKGHGTAVIEPVQSLNDAHKYRVVTLGNGLQATLIHKAGTDKAAACLDVQVGQFDDPADIPGMAHFLEHMLFLGTKKYPDESEYMKFIAAHDGERNAATDQEDTYYYFSVTATALDEALDRFAQFFTCPLFTPSCIDRERVAVHNEYKRNVANDWWRMWSLTKHLSNPRHPFSKFTIGNLDTLRHAPEAQKISVYDRLLEFYHRHYSADKMKLVVYGAETLDALEAIVNKYFNSVPNQAQAQVKQLKRPVMAPSDILNQASLNKPYSIVSLLDKHSIVIGWPCPSVQGDYRVPAHTMWAHWLNDEGPGSIIGVLKKRQWANHIMAEVDVTVSEFCIIWLHIDLTVEGLNRVQQILNVVYSYIDMIKKAPLNELQSQYAEQTQLHHLLFQYPVVHQPIAYVQTLARRMHEVRDARDLLTFGQVWDKQYDVDKHLVFGNCLAKSNSRTYVISPTWKGHTQWTEPTHFVEYGLWNGKVGESTVKHDVEPLSLPKGNPFIPTCFDLVPAPADSKSTPNPHPQPKPFIDVPGLRVYHHIDQTFKLPHASVSLQVLSSVVMTSLHDWTCHVFYEWLLKDTLVSILDPARCAGLQYKLESTRRGWTVVCDGYFHTLPLLVQTIVQHLSSIDLNATRLEPVRNSLLRYWHSTDRMTGPQQAGHWAGLYLAESHYSYAECAKYLPSVTIQDLERYQVRALECVHLDMWMNGHLDAKVTETLAKWCLLACKSKRTLLMNEWPSARTVQLPNCTRHVHRMTNDNPGDQNATLLVTFQLGPMSVELNTLANLLNVMIEQPLYDQLRTKEALAYQVNSYFCCEQGISTWNMYIVSSQYPSDYLEERFASFIDQFETKMTADAFKEAVASLNAQLVQTDKNLVEQSERYWWAISQHREDWFERYSQQAKHLQTVKLADVQMFFRDHLGVNGRFRKRLDIHVSPKQPLLHPDQWTLLMQAKMADVKIDVKTDVKTDDQSNQTAAGIKSADVSPEILAAIKSRTKPVHDPVVTIPLVKSPRAFYRSMPLYPHFT